MASIFAGTTVLITGASRGIGAAFAAELAGSGARLVLVGYSPETLPFNAGRVMFREIEVLGSLGCRPVDYPRAIEMVRQGHVRLLDLVAHRFPLERIAEALETLRGGDAIRVVVTP